MTKITTTTTRPTQRKTRVKRTKPKSERQKWLEAAVKWAAAMPARRQEYVAKLVAGWPEASAWEAYKVAIHGAVLSREHCLFENRLTIHCSDGTVHSRTVSRKDRGGDPYRWHEDDDYGPPVVGHGIH